MLAANFFEKFDFRQHPVKIYQKFGYFLVDFDMFLPDFDKLKPRVFFL